MASEKTYAFALPWIKRLLGIFLSAWLMFVLLRDMPLDSLSNPMRRVSTAVWIGASLGWLLSFFFRAFRLKQEWHLRGLRGFGCALQVTLIHTASSLVLPFRMGEAAYPVLMRSALNVNWIEGFRSLVWLRFQDAVVLMGLSLLCMPMLSGAIRLLIFMTGIAIFLWIRRLWRLQSAKPDWLIRLEPVFERTRWQAGWGWSVANWVIKLISVGCLLACMLEIHMVSGFQAALGGELMALIPLQGPASLGTYEAGVWLATSSMDLDMWRVAKAALAAHIFCLLLTLGFAVPAMGCLVLMPEKFLQPEKSRH